MKKEQRAEISETAFLQRRLQLIQLDYQLLGQVHKREAFKLFHAKKFSELTGRETEILKLLAWGCNNPQIARKLKISRSTVETHRKNLRQKLKLKSYNLLMKYALAFELVDFGQPR